MTSEVYFSVLPRETRVQEGGAIRRCLVLVEAYGEGDAGVAVMEVPPEVLANMAAAGRLAGDGLLGEIRRRLFFPRPVVWRGRTTR